MKNNISWHENNIKNMKQYGHSIYEQISILSKKYNKITDEISFYEKQVYEAQRKGKDSFDADKFLVKQGNRNVKY